MSISHVHYPSDEKVTIANIKIALVQAFASQLIADARESYVQVRKKKRAERAERGDNEQKSIELQC